MLGITLSADEIEAAPSGVRRWIKQEIACALGLSAGTEPATHTAALSSSDYNAEKASEDAGVRTPTVEIRLATPGTVKMGSPNDSTRAEAIRKKIAERAYELWESQGRPQGRDLINWRQAEHEIMSCLEDGAAPFEKNGRPSQFQSNDAEP
jgi:hypothetical protein